MPLTSLNEFYNQNLTEDEYARESKALADHFQHLQDQYAFYYDEMNEAYQIAKRHGLGEHGRNNDQDTFCRDFKWFLVEVSYHFNFFIFLFLTY